MVTGDDSTNIFECIRIFDQHFRVFRRLEGKCAVAKKFRPW